MNEFIGPFLGVMPRVSPELLSPGYAQVAQNCSVVSGILEPSKLPLATAIGVQSGTKTIYWFNREANGGLGYWFQWANVVSVIRGQIANDSFLRTYIFGDGVPKYTTSSIATSGGGPYPSVVRTLGLPAPNAPVATGPAGTLPSGSTKISTAYVMTYVSDIGEESVPGPASNIVDRWDGASVELAGLSVASGSFVVTLKRIYRIELNNVFQYVGSVGAATTTFTDNIDTEFLGEPVPSETWNAPFSGMVGATSLPNGGIVGWWGNTLAFCVPYQPHAWPIDYRLALDYDIVGAAVSAQGIIVCTAGAPYLITGSTPEGMAQNKMDTVAACVSAQSIVDMGEYILYAGSDGLIAAGGLSAELITKSYMTPEQWRTSVSPSTLKGYRYKDYYLGFYSGGSFAFHPQQGFLFFTDTADCGLIDDKTGSLYIKQGTTLKKWNEGTAATYRWRSRIIRLNTVSPFSCARLDAKAYPVTVRFYADGVLIKTKSVLSKKAFRLPNLSGYYNAEVEVESSNSIVSLQLSSSMSELS